MKVKKCMLSSSGQEAHFPEGNTSVAVCWNIKKTKKTLRGEDGLTYKADVWERIKKSGPYLCFMSIREYEKGGFVRDEDSPVEGGMSYEQAENIIKELAWALKYVESLKE
jgi:hypothetical protein